MNMERVSEKKIPQHVPLSSDVKEGFSVLIVGLGFVLVFVFIMGFLIGPDPEEL